MSRFVKVTKVHLKPIKEELTEEQKRIKVYYDERKILGYEPVGHTEVDINVDFILSMSDEKGVTRLEVIDFASGSNIHHVLETREEIYNAEKREM